jgi:hypothetical protein
VKILPRKLPMPFEVLVEAGATEVTRGLDDSEGHSRAAAEE